MHKFLLIGAPGLEPFFKLELEFRGLSFTELKTLPLRNHAALVFKSQNNPQLLFALRTAEDIFLVLEEIQLKTKQDLDNWSTQPIKDPILSNLKYLPKKRGQKVTTNFFSFVKQDKDYDIFRRTIAAALAERVQSQFRKWKYREPADVEIWVIMSESVAYTCLRLTDISFRQRRYRAAERPGSLPPPIAAAMVMASEPKALDIFFDPMCGSGTILLERGLWGGSSRLIGADLDAEAITLAEASAKKADIVIDLFCTDSTRTEFLNSLEVKFDAVVCNLPFGRQFQVASLQDLYSKLLSNLKEFLKPDARVVFLTSAQQELKQAAKSVGINFKKAYPIEVRGVRAEISVWRPD